MDNAAYTGTIQLTFAQSPYTPDGNAIIDEFRFFINENGEFNETAFLDSLKFTSFKTEGVL